MFQLDFLSLSAAQTIALWGGLALLVVLLFLRRPRTLTLAQGDGGTLQISRHALHRLLEACCEQIKGVASARVSVSRREGRFRTRIRLRIRPDAKLDAIQGYLTQEITDIYRQNLGLDEVGPVEIKVVGVTPSNPAF